MSDSRKSGREYRHRRRVRNTILAYLSLVIIIAGIAAGGFFGVKALIGVINDKKAKIEEEQLALEQQREAEGEGCFLDVAMHGRLLSLRGAAGRVWRRWLPFSRAGHGRGLAA